MKGRIMTLTRPITKVKAQSIEKEILELHAKVCRRLGIPTRVGHSEIEHYKPDPSRKKGWTNDHL